MVTYNPELTLGDARRLYFTLNNFAESDYEANWVKMKIGPFPFAFPNTKGRAKAVKLHDLHHILTEYKTTWRGEAEIGAWEVATGLRHHYEGWLLDLLAFAIGLVIAPRGVYRAFMRGRQSANLYRMEFCEEFLANRVGDVRRRLRLDREPAPPSFEDNVQFVFWALASVVTYLGTIAVGLLPFVVLALLFLWNVGVL
ncbi:MAG TPA: hypothetical protein VF666_04795 [Pyrinomonadaceae bacterium]|jgi:hypothetical protein